MVRREAGGRPQHDVSELVFESCQGRVILPVQGNRGVDEAERREVRLCTISEERGAVLEAREWRT